MKSASRKRS